MTEYISVHTRQDALEDGTLLRLQDYLAHEQIDVRLVMTHLHLAAALFPLGQIVITHHAARALPPSSVVDVLNRHQTGDWGDIDEEDWESNDRAVEDGGRVFSAYWCKVTQSAQNAIRIYVITEWNRESTTVLLPSEY